MKDIQFDSLYKFVISIGVLIIMLPFATLFFIYEDNQVFLLTQKQIKELTTHAQYLIDFKQKLIIQCLNSWYFYVFLLAIAIVGIFIVIYGLKNWMKIQKQIDLKTVLENKKLELEIGMSNDEKYEKTKKEVEIDKTYTGNPVTKSIINDYLMIENRVAQKVKIDFLNSHEVVHGAKINGFEYDIVAKGRGFLNKDYIFEIKYIEKGINIAWINDIIEKMKRQYQSYLEYTNRLPYSMLIIVTSNENYGIVNKVISQVDKINNFSIRVVQKDLIEETNFL